MSRSLDRAAEEDRAPARKRRPNRESASGPVTRALEELQSSAGNRAVAGLVASRVPGPHLPSMVPATATLMRNEKFDKAAGDTLDMAGAPDELKLPKEVADGMKSAWSASFPGGKSQEQGGILVKTKDGKYEWRPGKSGTGGSFTANYEDVKEGETLIAVGHTHPYDKSEGGHTKVSFSGGDLANFIYNNRRMAIVQSGKGQFVAVRTKEFNDLLKDLNDEGKAKMYTEMTKCWDDAVGAAKGTMQERVEAAVRAVSEKYHLVYYAGTGGTVKLKGAKVHVEKAKGPAKERVGAGAKK